MRLSWKSLAVVLLTAGLVVACAPGSQTVKLEPSVDVDERTVEEPRELALRVVDRRPREIFGYRDEGRGATIEGEPALADAVREGLTRALEKRGVEVVEWDDAADRRLQVEITSFDYTRTGGFLRRHVELRTEWDVSGSIDGSRYSSRARSSSQERALFGPSEAKNTELVNRVLSRGIRQVVGQSDLQRLLEGDE